MNICDKCGNAYQDDIHADNELCHRCASKMEQRICRVDIDVMWEAVRRLAGNDRSIPASKLVAGSGDMWFAFMSDGISSDVNVFGTMAGAIDWLAYSVWLGFLPERRLLDVMETAWMLGKDKSTLNRWCQIGCPVVTTYEGRRFSLPAVVEWTKKYGIKIRCRSG